jgi:hypothetical protein
MTRFFGLSPQPFLIVAHAFIAIVGAVSVGVYLTFFPPYFRGWPEITPEYSVAGWAVNKAAPETSVEVQLFVDDRFIAAGTANISRPDVVAAGRAKSDKCGFNFALPSFGKGEHKAQVYAVNEVGAGNYRTLQSLGKPVFFKIP